MKEQQRSEYQASLDPRRQQAVRELTQLVQAHYPLTEVTVAPSEDNPDITHVIATVDIDDPDEVADLVMERMLELQIEEGLPVYLIPLRTPMRTAKLLQQQRSRTHSIVSRPPVQL